MSERKTIKKKLNSIDYDFDGLTFDEAITKLASLKEYYPNKYKSFDKFIIEVAYGDYGDYEDSDTQRLYVFGVRNENDEEFHTRQQDESQRKEYRRAEYERLKKEFEG